MFVARIVGILLDKQKVKFKLLTYVFKIHIVNPQLPVFGFFRCE